MVTDVLIIKFKNEISLHEIPLFRGAIINSLDQKYLLFHNHREEDLRYGYPLIQYKCIKGCAAIVCLQKGVEEVGELFSSSNFRLQLGERPVDFHIDYIRSMRFDIQVWDRQFNYRINRWCCLNNRNYERYNALEGVAERVSYLESILNGNILSMAKGIGYTIGQRIESKITSISDQHFIRVKGVRMACFDMEFSSNVSFPDYIGLGKHTSINFGVVTENKERHINNK